MSDTTPAPRYDDGKGGNYDSDPDANAVPDDYVAPSDTGGLSPESVAAPAGDQVATDNGGTTPDTTTTEPVAGDAADTTTGTIEGGDGVSGSGPGVAEADPEAPVEPVIDVIEAGEESTLEPEPAPQGEVPESDVVSEPVPDVIDAESPETDPELQASAAASEGDAHHVWTVWSRKRKAWFNVIEDEGIHGEPNGYRLKSSAQAEGRDLAREREVIHFIQKKNGEVGSENSYGYRPKHEL